jgi:outer membrane receptor for ferrienterochelin and colicin
MVPVAGIAQDTTSSARVTVYGPDGNPVEGALVTVTDTRTGISRSGTTNAQGFATERGLAVGGPYTIVVEDDRYAKQTVTDVPLRLGDTYEAVLQLGANVMEEVVVTSAAIKGSQLAVGPSSIFGLEDLETLPAINRDLRDIIQQDPRIYIDAGFVGAIQCAGANPRFNSLTVDGIRMNDNFGLNSNGYPTERTPFPFDALQEVAVELAPFDVNYGGFSACNVNAVTKSGQNEWHGSAFFDYTDDSLAGDKLEGERIAVGDFDEKRYGFTIGGPILKNRLFFFVAYEKLEGAELFDRGVAGSNRAVQVQGVSQAQFDRIDSIVRTLYDYDPGGLPLSLPVEDEKVFVKIDWNISDNHRAAFVYNWNDGFSISQSDSDSDELEFSNHYYERGAELTQYSLQVWSDWTDSFSTEFRYSNTELDNRQISLAGVDFGEVQIRTYNDHDNDGSLSRATVYLGADDSRHANKLFYETDQIKLAGIYNTGNHVITGGFEQEAYDVFNMFIQESEGEFRFDRGCSTSNPDGCIDDFEAGLADRITYENAAPSNVKIDAAATFKYKVNSAYIQDDVVFGDWSIVLGLRYDWYTSNDVPRQNDNFEARYGFSNQQNMDGKDLLQPRLGFNWQATDAVLVHGGVGLFSGGNPNVWISNNYSNDGQTQVERQDRSKTPFADINWTGDGRPFWNVPQDLFDQVASGTADSGVNSMDPDFDLPSSLKVNLGFTWNFGADLSWTLNGDIIYTKANDSAIVIDATMEPVGTAPDGRPIYRPIDRSDPDCSDPTSSDCSGRSQDFILTNVKGSDAKQTQLAIGIGKSYFDAGVDWFLGYAYTEAEDVNPMTSSVAFSNFANMATSDPNDPGLARSNYEIPHRFTARVTWQHAFWGDNMSRISWFMSHNQGRPFTYTFTSGFMFGDSVGFIDRHLLYVPDGTSDPNVVFADGFNQGGFQDFLASSGLAKYAGSIVPRNAFHSDWWTTMDIKFEQEFPGFTQGHKFAAFLIIRNLTNMLNDEWGVFYESSFPRFQSVINASINDDNQYVFSSFVEPQSQSRVGRPSLWETRIGLRYSF